MIPEIQKPIDLPVSSMDEKVPNFSVEKSGESCIDDGKTPDFSGDTIEEGRSETEGKVPDFSTDLSLNQLPNKSSIENFGTQFFDDNGVCYKIDNKLLPDTTYTVNGYEYKTDNLGRIIQAGGEIQLSKTGERKSLTETGVGGDDKKATDDRGHLIADRFDGSNQIENLVPMDSNLNRGGYKSLENELAEAKKEGKDVSVSIEIIYDGGSKRPSEFVVSYTINGEKYERVFINESSKAIQS